MPSKTSWLNKQLILQNVRSAGWISIIYFLGLLFALPLDIFSRYENDTRINFQPQPVESLFQYNAPIQVGLLIIVPVLMAVFLFRFLHVKHAAEMMHSLPLKREKIFYHYTLSGIVGLIFPVVFTSLIVVFLYSVVDLSIYFQMRDIFIWAGTVILLNLVLFTAGVFVAMMTGLSVVQGILTYIFLLFPAGIMVLFVSNLYFLLFGYPMDYYLNSKIELMSPLTFIAMLDERTLDWKITAAYMAALLVICGLSLFFYKKRKIESASETIAFPKLRSVFKYGMTFCFTMLGGVYFAAISEVNRTGWLLFGYIIGTVIGYYIAEMVLQKTWRVFHKIKGLLIYGASMAIVLLGIQVLDVYEERVPKQEEIEQVFFTNTPYLFANNTSSYGFEFIPEPLREQGNIQAVRELHQQIIENKELVQSDNSQYKEHAFFLYELKNGRKMIREYLVDRDIFAEYLGAFQESNEYKRTSHRIFHLNTDKVKYLTISTQGSKPDFVSVNNRKDIEEFIKIYQKDVLAASYKESIYFENYGASVEFFMNQEYSVHLPLAPSYKGVLKWLAEKDFLDRISAPPEDIASIQIVKDKHSLEMSSREIAIDIANRSDTLKVEDKKQIDELLQRTTGWLPNHQYAAVIHYSGRKHFDVVYMDEQYAPEFVKEHFRE